MKNKIIKLIVAVLIFSTISCTAHAVKIDNNISHCDHYTGEYYYNISKTKQQDYTTNYIEYNNTANSSSGALERYYERKGTTDTDNEVPFILNFIFSLLVTAAAYLLVPLIFCIRGINGKKLNAKQIKTIIIINAAIIWLIFMIIKIELGIDGTSAAFFLWSSIGYFLMKKKCLSSSNNQKSAKNTTKSSTEYIIPLQFERTPQQELSNFQLNNHEMQVITAYRNHPEMQDAVDRLLCVHNNIKKDI